MGALFDTLAGYGGMLCACLSFMSKSKGLHFISSVIADFHFFFSETRALLPWLPVHFLPLSASPHA